MFNNRFVFVPPSDQHWGHINQDGSWSGITGMIKRNVKFICHENRIYSCTFIRLNQTGNRLSCSINVSA